MSARLEPRLEQCPPSDPLEDLEPGDRIARRRGVEGVARPVAAVTADRRLDPAGTRPGLPEDEREVPPLDAPLADRLRQPRVRLVRARDDEEARCVAVESVDDPRSLGVAAGRTEREKPVRESRPIVLARWMHDEPGRLVDDEEVLVVVHHGETELDRPELLRRGQLDSDILATGQSMALELGAPVHENRPGDNEALGEDPRADLRPVGEDGIEPPTRVRVRNAKAARCQRRRSCGRPPRTRGTEGPRRPR